MFHCKINDQEYLIEAVNLVLKHDVNQIIFTLTKDIFNSLNKTIYYIKIMDINGQIVFEDDKNIFQLIEKYYNFQEKNKEEVYILTYGDI